MMNDALKLLTPGNPAGRQGLQQAWGIQPRQDHTQLQPAAVSTAARLQGYSMGMMMNVEISFQSVERAHAPDQEAHCNRKFSRLVFQIY
jgi:hypothetical protein